MAQIILCHPVVLNCSASSLSTDELNWTYLAEIESTWSCYAIMCYAFTVFCAYIKLPEVIEITIELSVRFVVLILKLEVIVLLMRLPPHNGSLYCEMVF